MKRGWMALGLALVVTLGFAAGCGAKDAAKETADKAGAVAEGAMEAAGDVAEQGMEKVGDTLEGVQEAVEGQAEEFAEGLDEIKQQLTDKQKELEEVKAKLEKMSPKDLLGDEGKKLKEQSTTLMDEISKLKEKLGV